MWSVFNILIPTNVTIKREIEREDWKMKKKIEKILYLKERVVMDCLVSKGAVSPSAILCINGSKSACDARGTKEVKRDSNVESSMS